MISQRVGVAAMRRAAKPSLFSQNVTRAALASHVSALQTRPVATTKTTIQENREILDAQRRNRPVSPHLSIYKLEQTWFGASAWTRITGAILSGSSYVFFSGYLVAPLLGWHWESASVAAAFAGLPFLAKAAVKFALAFPFSFHFFQGIRHIVHDVGYAYAKPILKKGDTMVWAAGVLTGLYLAVGL
jgi:succinate dehydrogenase (ubiquinone) cytochrome b560 subunit